MTQKIHSVAAPPDWRGVCEELLRELENAIRVLYHEDGTHHISAADAVIAKADAALAQPEPEVVGYVDPERTGSDREMLEAFYAACRSEGGTADEIHLRGLRAVLARWGRPAPAPAEGEVADDYKVASDETMRRIRSTTKRWKVTLTITTNDSAIDTRLGLGIWKVLDTESEILESVSLPQLLTSTSALLEQRHTAPAPAEGEVAELAEFLRVYGDEVMDEYGDVGEHDMLTRAADLLEQCQAAPVPAEGEVAAEVPAVTEVIAWLRTEAEIDDGFELTQSAAYQRRAAELLERHAAPVPVGMIPVEYCDLDYGARIVSEPSEEGPGGCWVVLNSRHVSPLTEFPTAEAAWNALQAAQALPLPSGEVEHG